jgi:hypothetical protein
MAPLLTYVLLALCGAALIFGFVLERRKTKYAWVLQIAAFLAAYFVLRPGRMPEDPRQALKVSTSARAPVFIDMYSNY